MIRNEFFDLVNGNKHVLVYFYANCCIPCKKMDSVLAEVMEKLQDKVMLLKIDVDSRACRHPRHVYKVMSVPTLMLIKDGYIYWQHTEELTPRELLFKVESYLWPY